MHREKASLDACIHHHAARQLINSNFDSLRWKSDLYTRYKDLQALKIRNLKRGESIVEGSGRRQYSLLGTEQYGGSALALLLSVDRTPRLTGGGGYGDDPSQAASAISGFLRVHRI